MENSGKVNEEESTPTEMIIILWFIVFLTVSNILLSTFKNIYSKKLKALRKEVPKYYSMVKTFGLRRLIGEYAF